MLIPAPRLRTRSRFCSLPLALRLFARLNSRPEPPSLFPVRTGRHTFPKRRDFMRTKNSPKLTALAVALALACAALALAQGGARGPAQTGAGSPYDEQVKALLARPEIQAAFADVEKNRDAILREWIAITEINAPSGEEAERAAFIEAVLRGYT